MDDHELRMYLDLNQIVQWTRTRVFDVFQEQLLVSRVFDVSLGGC